jgi:hypothetical protein
MGVGGQHHTLAALPPAKTQYPVYRRLGGPQGQSGQVQKISPPPRFNPRTVQPTASRYTNWGILAWWRHTVWYILFHSIAMCRMWRFLAVLRSFFHSTPSYTLYLPLCCTYYSSILPHITCHLFLGIDVSKFIYRVRQKYLTIFKLN